MYVHIGGEYSISDRYIIGIIDMDSITPKQTDMIHFLAKAEDEGRAEYVSEEIPRSVIITFDRVYFTSISTTTLHKRIHDMHTSRDKAFL